MLFYLLWGCSPATTILGDASKVTDNREDTNETIGENGQGNEGSVDSSSVEGSDSNSYVDTGYNPEENSEESPEENLDEASDDQEGFESSEDSSNDPAESDVDRISDEEEDQIETDSNNADTDGNDAEDGEESSQEPSSEDDLPEDSDLWNWGEQIPEDADFSGDYEGIIYMYNQQTGFSICEGNGIVSTDNDDVQTGVGSCTTSTNLNFEMIFDGLMYSSSSYPNNYGESHASLEGDVEIILPSGDIYSTSYYGDCYVDSYSYLSMYWDVEILTPNGPRQYSGYFYTY